MTARQPLLLALLAALCLAWLDPARDRVIEGNRLYTEGKYDDATTRYGEALTDDPDSPRLNFNMGTAHYKAGKYAEALASFERVHPAADDPTRVARAAYNTGNAHYRIGSAAESTNPQDALEAYAAALVAYRRAIAADPADRDAKFNYEYVTKKLDELQKKLAEQQSDQQQQQQQDHPQQQEQQQDQPPQDAPQDQEPNTEAQDTPQPEATEQPRAGTEPPPSPAAQEPDDTRSAQDTAEPDDQPDTAGGSEHPAADQRMSPDEARALLDSSRNEELTPDEFARHLQPRGVVEPAQDW